MPEEGEFKCELDSYPGREGIGCSVFYSPSIDESVISKRQKQFIQMKTNFDKWSEMARWANELHQSIELSVRVPISAKSNTAALLERWIDRHGIQICADQSGQTLKLLQVLMKFQNR